MAGHPNIFSIVRSVTNCHMFSPGLDTGTFRVLGERDSHVVQPSTRIYVIYVFLSCLMKVFIVVGRTFRLEDYDPFKSEIFRCEAFMVLLSS